MSSISYSLHTILWCVVVVTAILFSYCHSPASNQDEEEQENLYTSPYLNIADTVQYVGMETCRSCHANIYDTFIKTGMGQSFDHASPQKSAAQFGKHIVVRDTMNNYDYHPFWRNDSLFVLEFRIEGRDTIHQYEQYVQYIVGSGQHTNSHICQQNGYLYQAPITFYTQKGIWDLAPGFGGKFNSRFERIIGMECMTCHSNQPQHVNGSENKYINEPVGIQCERCHGAGGVHVREKLSGVVRDTSVAPDYTIVNPRRLSRDLQMSICQRCHLQGVAILKEGKSFADFKPSTPLSETMSVFLPEYDGNQTHFIMASQAHRLTKSACYQLSQMTCLSCHNPHISVTQTPKEVFKAACQKCHEADAMPTAVRTKSGKNANINETKSSSNKSAQCSLPLNKRLQKNDNDCASCHMPPSPSIDIPHVTVHDHFIRRPLSEEEKQKTERFIRLEAVSGGKVNALTRAKAYLHYYESYTNDPALLDSAAWYLQKTDPQKVLSNFETTIHLHYLRNDYDALLKIADRIALSNLRDAWTAYRIGEAYWTKKNKQKALAYFQKAVQKEPINPNFNNKMGAALVQNGHLEDAIAVFEKILSEIPDYAPAMVNLGFALLNRGELLRAEQLYAQVLAISPDYEMALLNMAALQLLKKDKIAARHYAQQLLKRQPNHVQARQLLQSASQ